MKEIRILTQQLKNYPNNFFVYPSKEPSDYTVDHVYEWKDGLVVCDMDGEQQGFIETGGEGEVIIEA